MVLKPATKREIKVTVNFKPVKLAEVTPHQRQLHRLFWAKLISRVNDELNVRREDVANNLEKTANIETEPMSGGGAKEDKNP